MLSNYYHFFHLIFLAVGFGTVITIDSFGLLWVMKKTELRQVLKVASITQVLIWVGWVGLVITGLAMVGWSLRGLAGILQLKLFFVLLLGINGVLLFLLKRRLKEFAEIGNIPLLYKFRVFLTSLISQIGWWGAIIIGFLIGNVKGMFRVAVQPEVFIYWILGALIVIALAGEMALRKIKRG